ncbi:glutamine amidotransferase [Rhodophyticola porphyridii]|uniref:Glutamine amidotransferase n=1 Tax=Rhodophyticola porphyridii TaxID=1852017 RepID=A0A3L9Y7Y3_9RHOB|nr:glutamine amidotransferase [Rhodophyticola porphyridii]RMA43207.1 glutamine amidotransferase [Rhodophyticola porphyridii]
MKPFLIIQLRPEDEAADEEYAALLARSGLTAAETRRIRLDQQALPALSLEAYSGVIVGGGPGCVSDAPEDKDPLEARIEADILSLMPEITRRDMPYMGCCYGLGILAKHLGGEVSKARYGEPIGAVECRLTENGAADPLMAGLPRDFKAFVGHKEAVQALPPGAVHLARSDLCPYQMIRAGKNLYATQFHPEADSASFVMRIDIYRHRGYFAPEEADALKANVQAEEVTVPERMLRAFVGRYRG